MMLVVFHLFYCVV